MIEQDLYTFLSTAVGHVRVYPLVLPQNVTYPASTYHRIGGIDELSSGTRSDLVEGRFQVDCYAETYLAVRTEAKAIRDALSGYAGTMGSTRVDSAVRDREDEEYEQETKLFRVSMDFIINFQE